MSSWRSLSIAFGILQALAVSTGSYIKSYDGDQVWEIPIYNKDELEFLRHLCERSVYYDKLDIWREPVIGVQPAHVQVSSSILHKLVAILNEHGIQYEVMIEDVGSLVKEEEQNKNRLHKLDGVNHWLKNSPRWKREARFVNNDIVGTYATLAQIENWLKQLNEYFVEEVQMIRLENITYEGRPLCVIKIGKPTGGWKPTIWLDGGIHAREWLSPATVVFTIYNLLHHYLNNGTDKYLVEDLDWYILPVLNPDGYVYSHEQKRLWRKNRHYWSNYSYTHPYDPNMTCYGTDLNRNFPFHWGEVGSYNHYSCMETFRGLYPGSDLETKAVMEFLRKRNDHIKAYISLHSYGQMVLTRWAYSTEESPEDSEELERVGQAMASAIINTLGTNYTFGVAGNILYNYSGGSADWAKGVANITYSYAVELRDKGQSGFFFPVNQSLDVGNEMYSGLRVLAQEVRLRFPPEAPTSGVGELTLMGMIACSIWASLISYVGSVQ